MDLALLPRPFERHRHAGYPDVAHARTVWGLTQSRTGRPSPLATDPRQVWDRLFRDLDSSAADIARERAETRAVLDAVSAEFKGLLPRLGAADRSRLDEHLGRLAEIEKGLEAVSAVGAAACRKPESPQAVYNQNAADKAQKGGAGSNEQFNPVRDAAMPLVGKLMMDQLVMALACDRTRVATLQWVDSQAYNTFPWLGLDDDHHGYQHDRGYKPEAIKVINRWYAEQLACLLGRLAQTQEGGRTMLDNTLVFWGTEISHPNSHGQKNMPFVLAGGGGGFRMGRWVRFANLPHNDLLVSLKNAFGVPGDSFGKAKFCTGALAGLG